VSDLGLRAVSAAGLLVMVALAWACSLDRRRVPWRVVGWGLALQLGLGVLLLATPVGGAFFAVMNAIVAALGSYADAGSRFVFGSLAETGFSFVVNVLPIIVFMGAVFAVLYHLGVMQRVVDLLAAGLGRTLGTSGAESLAAVANVFLGMTESALVVRPYLERMTRSELFCLMTVGMSTVAGSVMVAYVTMLGGGDYAGHLATASLLSAPAGILVAKLMLPEAETPQTVLGAHAGVARSAVNVIDAAAEGAIGGLRIAAYVGALLVAFVALIALANDATGFVGGFFGAPDLTLERLLGLALAPLAFAMGVPWADSVIVGGLLGVKTVLNEFIAFQQLGELVKTGTISPRAAVISSYALCGFANFGSLAILLGGITGLAPTRRAEAARLGLRSIVSGTLASFMTACVAGVLV
jgi:CNT family concentrative nucleoside transporter